MNESSALSVFLNLVLIPPLPRGKRSLSVFVGCRGEHDTGPMGQCCVANLGAQARAVCLVALTPPVPTFKAPLLGKRSEDPIHPASKSWPAR